MEGRSEISQKRNESMLMEILVDTKSVTGFLHEIFGFLKRHTDFYYVKKDPNESVGFPEGVKEKIVLHTMKYYEPSNRDDSKSSTGISEDEPPPAIEEVEISCEENIESPSSTESIDKPMKTETYFNDNDYKNGGRFNNYCWSQTMKDVELQFKLPFGIRTGKDFHVTTKVNYIEIINKTDDRILLCGELFNKIKHNDVVWTVEGNRLVVNMDKAKPGWWEKFLSIEKNIDTKKINCEQNLDEYPQATQAAIEKLRFEQMQIDAERQSPENQAKIELLKKAWDAENSPFKGTPFDPSMVKF